MTEAAHTEADGMTDDHARAAGTRGSRRRFLRGTVAGVGGIVLGGAGNARDETLTFAPAAFGTDAGGTLIWVGGSGPDPRRVRVHVGTDAALGRSVAGPAAIFGRRSGFAAAIRLAGLASGETYYYRVVDAGSGEPASGVGRFKTAPAVPRPFSFAFSGDVHESYAPFRLFDVIGARDPDFFLHLGDTVYADQPVREFAPSLAHYRRKHAIIRRDPHLQRFLARHLTWATWDDHEIEDDAHAGHRHLLQAMEAFREYWPCDPVARRGLYRRFAWAGTDFFILDTRGFRSPQQAPNGPHKTMLGSEQKRWFLDGLKASSAPFKFVMTSVPFHAESADAWGGYRAERDEIVRSIRTHGVSGVIFLTADFHMARDWTSVTTGLREYMAGPIAAFTQFQADPAARDRYRKAGAFHFGDGPNFGLLRVDPVARNVALEFIGADGNVLYSTRFSA